jgi:hypothetical protein
MAKNGIRTILNAQESWVGPVKIGRLLDNCVDPKVHMPPDGGSAYVVTKHAWQSEPTPESLPLYVGGITGKSDRFKTRIGDLIIDALGFYHESGSPGHSSGGQSINKWCGENSIHPFDLHIAWVEPNVCYRCLEGRLYKLWKDPGTLLNKKAPPKCTTAHC